MLSKGVVDPVKMNWPNIFRISTSWRTASHSWGASCHSSINLGLSPSKRREGLISAANNAWRPTCGSCRKIQLFANCKAVVVFPHHLGPWISTAPVASNLSLRSVSAIPQIGRFLFLRMAVFHSATWLFFGVKKGPHCGPLFKKKYLLVFG
jgi:hypothetical protein